MISLMPLKKFLAYHNIKYTTLSEKTGIPYATILSMMNTNTFQSKALDKICQTLNLNIKDIMEYQ